MATDDFQFGGEETFAAPPATLYDLLTNLDSLVGIIPDVVSSAPDGNDSVIVTLRPGFSFLRGKMKLTLSVQTKPEAQSAIIQSQVKGIGVKIVIESRIEVAASEDGSRINWESRVMEMKGLISSVSPALVRAAADQVINKSWKAVRRKLAD